MKIKNISIVRKEMDLWHLSIVSESGLLLKKVEAHSYTLEKSDVEDLVRASLRSLNPLGFELKGLNDPTLKDQLTNRVKLNETP